MAELKSVPPVIFVGEINGRLETVNVHEQLIVGCPENLNEHMDELASRYAHWGVLRAQAKQRESMLKDSFKRWMAQQKAAVCATGKYSSETAKEDAVLTQFADEYARRTKELLDAEYQRALLEIIEEAFLVKKDMLVSLGANTRQELASTGMYLSSWNRQFDKKRAEG